MTPEVAVRRQIQAWLGNKGVFTFVHDSVGIYDAKAQRYRRNVDPFRFKGVADVLGLLPGGRFLAIEVKKPGGQKNLFGQVSSKGYASPEQKEFLERVRKLGGIGILARGIPDVEAGLRDAGVSLPIRTPSQRSEVGSGGAIVCPHCHTGIETTERLRIDPGEQP